MAHTNIDLFNRFSLAVFAKLHESFPVPVDLDFESIMLSVTPDDWGYKETFDAIVSAREAVSFLENEGFLTVGFKGVDGRGVSHVRLTMKGLAILDAVPTSLEKKESLITSIKAMAKKGLKDAASEQVGELAKQAIALALASGPALASMVRG